MLKSKKILLVVIIFNIFLLKPQIYGMEEMSIDPYIDKDKISKFEVGVYNSGIENLDERTEFCIEFYEDLYRHIVFKDNDKSGIEVTEKLKNYVEIFECYFQHFNIITQFFCQSDERDGNLCLAKEKYINYWIDKQKYDKEILKHGLSGLFGDDWCIKQGKDYDYNHAIEKWQNQETVEKRLKKIEEINSQYEEDAVFDLKKLNRDVINVKKLINEIEQYLDKLPIIRNIDYILIYKIKKLIRYIRHINFPFLRTNDFDEDSKKINGLRQRIKNYGWHFCILKKYKPNVNDNLIRYIDSVRKSKDFDKYYRYFGDFELFKKSDFYKSRYNEDYKFNLVDLEKDINESSNLVIEAEQYLDNFEKNLVEEVIYEEFMYIIGKCRHRIKKLKESTEFLDVKNYYEYDEEKGKIPDEYKEYIDKTRNFNSKKILELELKINPLMKLIDNKIKDKDKINKDDIIVLMKKFEELKSDIINLKEIGQDSSRIKEFENDLCKIDKEIELFYEQYLKEVSTYLNSIIEDDVFKKNYKFEQNEPCNEDILKEIQKVIEIEEKFGDYLEKYPTDRKYKNMHYSKHSKDSENSKNSENSDNKQKFFVLFDAENPKNSNSEDLEDLENSNSEDSKDLENSNIKEILSEIYYRENKIKNLINKYLEDVQDNVDIIMENINKDKCIGLQYVYLLYRIKEKIFKCYLKAKSLFLDGGDELEHDVKFKEDNDLKSVKAKMECIKDDLEYIKDEYFEDLFKIKNEKNIKDDLEERIGYVNCDLIYLKDMIKTDDSNVKNKFFAEIEEIKQKLSNICKDYKEISNEKESSYIEDSLKNIQEKKIILNNLGND